MKRGATAVVWLIGLGALAAQAAAPYAREMMQRPAVVRVHAEVRLPTIEVSRPTKSETTEGTARVG